MSALALPQLRSYEAYAPVVLRVVLGIIMAAHGWSKLSGGPGTGFASMLENQGLFAPVALAWLVTLVELVGGIALIVGLLTRISAVLISAVLVVAIILVKSDMGLIAQGGAGAELDLAILAGLIALVILGPGPLSVDQALGWTRESS